MCEEIAFNKLLGDIEFHIDKNFKMYGIVYLDKLNLISDILTSQQEEIENLKSIIKEVKDKLNTQLAFTSSYQLNYESALYLIEEVKKILNKELK